ncbi:MAG TPA: M23 family metallopeptidase [Gemmatimonadaceae bacterium]|jgi:murein DD-endopeptidase MepM/ murein hydrolase activator NlpD|nr:M23 family metallopeptidase [Gemmatimonadaceae bacterium]
MTERNKEPKGYGNIYTPHAGSMVIQVQREGGLANRTIVLNQRTVRVMRFVLSRSGMAIGAVLLALFLFFAIQAARVPVLTHRLATLESDAKRLDTLQVALAQLQKRYEQVQTMLGAPVVKRDTIELTVPSRFPLDSKGFVTRGVGSGQEYGVAHPGLDIAVPSATQVRAAGGGMVVEVSETPEYGKMIRLSHPEKYETLYGHLSQTLVKQGDKVALGAVIALSGNTGRSTAPHLHFEVRKDGQAVDPMQLIQEKRQ